MVSGGHTLAAAVKRPARGADQTASASSLLCPHDRYSIVCVGALCVLAPWCVVPPFGWQIGCKDAEPHASSAKQCSCGHKLCVCVCAVLLQGSQCW